MRFHTLIAAVALSLPRTAHAQDAWRPEVMPRDWVEEYIRNNATREFTDAQAARPYLVIGLFFGRIEEGARIFTPARLLPFGHPEAGTHEFPTLQQLHATEFPALVWLGAQAGLQLWATLQRYPTEPADDWPYTDFAPPPDTASLRGAIIVHRPRAQSPLPGLRAVLFAERRPVLFLVDTRPFTLAERRMKGATTMGLDLSRAELLAALDRASAAAAPHGLAAVIYDPRPAPSPRPKPE